MDRSFLSQPAVIAASRSFVCVRLTTYENKDENDLLKTLCRTRSGEVENTVFTILTSDGRKQLARASRGADHTFASAQRMIATMKSISAEYGTKPWTDPALPAVANVRLAINVASADNQPLVVLFAADPGTRRDLENRVRSLAWSEPFIGRFIYATTADPKDLAGIAGLEPTPGVLIVEPDRFGQKVTLLKRMPASGSSEALARALTESLTLHRRLDKTFANHVHEGQRQGVFWETALPVTDPMELRARERGRRKVPD